MEKGKHGVLIFIIGILAVVSSIVSVIVEAKAMLFSTSINGINDILYLATASENGIVELAFSIIKITIGISLIKQWKNHEIFEVNQTLSKLIGAVVYASFLSMIVGVIAGAFFVDGVDGIEIDIFTICIYILYYLVLKSVANMVRKRKISSLIYGMTIISLIAVYFSCSETIGVLATDFEILDFSLSISNVVIGTLIVAFSVCSIVFYHKHPDLMYEDMVKGEDSEIVKEKEKYNVVRIYATRGSKDIGNVFSMIFYALSIAVAVCGVYFVAREESVQTLLSTSLEDFVSVFTNFGSGSISSLLELFTNAYLVILYPLTIVSCAIGVITRRTQQKIGVMSLASLSVMLVAIGFFGVMMKFIFEFSYTRTIDFSNYSIWELVIGALFIFQMITSKFIKQTLDDINEGVNRGETFHSNIKNIFKVTLYYGIETVVGFTALYLMQNNLSGNKALYFPAFAISSVLVVIALAIEVKHPFTESFLVRRKKISLSKTDTLLEPEKPNEIEKENQTEIA